MAKYTIEDTTLSAIADAIRSKEGSSELIAVLEMAQRILDIQTGIDTSDATATEEGVLNGLTFYANGVKKTGNIPRHTVANNSVEWAIKTMPQGDGDATTAVDIPAGYYEGGSYPTSPLAIRNPSDVTPGTSDITIQGGAWFTNSFKVKGDADLKAANIKSGVSIFGVDGTFTSDANATAANIRKNKTAYVNGVKITGSMSELSSATIMPGTESKYIDPGVYIAGTQTIKGDPSLKAANIKKGVTIFNVAGSLEEVNIDTELATQTSLLTQIEYALYAKENPGAPSAPPK